MEVGALASSSAPCSRATVQLRRSTASLRGTAVSGRQVRHVKARQQLQCNSSMGIGISSDFENNQPPLDFVVPKAAYGLSTRQMAALGLTDEEVIKRMEPRPDLLRAKAYYGGEVVNQNTRVATKMSAGVQTPGQAPPDLPSLLLDGRIVYIGMPLVSAVTELVISELLWLNYNNPEKQIYLYINSIGTQQANGQAVGFETEAYAIIDTLAYIRPEVHTLAVGAAYGNAAMILASGKKGCRYSLPNARIMTCPPRINRSFGSASNIMIKANELENNMQTYVDFMVRFTGRDKEEVRKDMGRNRYYTPQQAIEYGIIDKIVQPDVDDTMIEKKDYERMLVQAQAYQQGGRRAPAGVGGGAEAGQ